MERPGNPPDTSIGKMQNPLYRPHGLLDNNRKLAVENLKLCPVCHTVNAKLNHECFVCRWHGAFSNDASAIEEGLLDVLEQCPELIDCILIMPRRREGFLARTWGWIKSRFSRRLDFRA
jgi:hypothetical protein